MLRRLALIATLASLAWAVSLTALAAAGNPWVLDRVAGGYFADDGVMPMPLRLAYGGMTVIMVLVAWLCVRYYTNDVTHRQRNLGRIVMLMFVVSAVLNAMSRSLPERYNAIGAALTVLGVSYLRRRPVSDYVDLRIRR